MTSQNFRRVFSVVICVTMCCFCNAQVIQGRLVFRSGDRAKGYKLIVVSQTTENERITRSLHFSGNNTEQLRAMNARVEFSNSEGVYYFKGLSTGRYILKVCTINGMSYKFRLNTGSYALMKIKDLPPKY